MPEKVVAMGRAQGRDRIRPVMLAVAGDSASGKSTLCHGLMAVLGADRCLSVCVDDYHRHERSERAELSFTALHPDGNYLDIAEQHLQLLALGRPILKPVYDHATGTFSRAEYVEPPDFVIVHGLHPLHSKLMRACFDVTVYLDPSEDLRRSWKIDRDTAMRGYQREDVMAELARREPESEAFIRPQRRHADLVVRFAPDAGPQSMETDALSADILLRPTLQHPALDRILAEHRQAALQLRIIRDLDGTPTDCLHIREHAPGEETHRLMDAIWAGLGIDQEPPAELGLTGDGHRREPLAVTQLVVLQHLLHANTQHPPHDGGVLTGA
ncbi:MULTISPECIES: phosphoribulokinase [unclassified Nocardioides]|uniref:phosphoribulokinase n=1 Tax=unclassified Nocardioides TaxID=2615069 RepID=UPI0006F9188F|nr:MULTISPECIES: phosphoribulokinase [unclassified Nocardioides]KRA27985.1 phosphoribulokinase [Nocardioides sp. Root614]KRA85959.1 phosphoribulokinase [Nocardioides sp. Root682]